MPDQKIYFSSVGWEATDTTLKTPRGTYQLDNIEYVSVRQPLFWLSFVVSSGLLIFAFRFWPYLFNAERIAVVIVTSLVMLTTYQLATLRVHSLAMREADMATIIGRTSTLKKVREAVEKAMDKRKSQQKDD